MSEGGGMTVLDGTHLRSLQISLPDSAVNLNGAELLDFADSKASDSLFGLSLPQSLKFSAFQRLNITDDVTFRKTELTREAATDKLNHYLTAIADELKDNPLVVSVLDGNTLRLFLEDEDDFAMLAENLFTELDIEDKGKISKCEIRNALVNMGVEMGIPPFEELPLLNDILNKHGAEGEGDLGQSQFAELLQPILQEVADTLSQKHVVIIQNIKIVNGSELRKLLMTEKKLNNVTEKMLQDKRGKKAGQNNAEIIRDFLEENGKELGLPASEANEAVVLLYDAVFSDIKNEKCAAESEDEFKELVKEILEKFAEQLEANPVYCDLDN
ncbi:uncharacterized protein LOC8269341 [Ricinus communis]|uniref:Calcium ion binding protein, putative n=1 Tax=Ricinus communis TaxID=3988 RepID=B9SZ80_RICCO|nr:uncharacterized protein LOC8269341 [Ricinus communis]EEF31112.1 calcium ion binding protein, putative [Ricinus communis]|eukprot:XP_002531299.1 uncharacterized protein LOC8269341 [Ricinus communis]